MLDLCSPPMLIRLLAALGLALFGVGLCGTVVGQLVVQAAIRRLKKESIITLLIAAVIGGSTLLMGANGVVEVIHSIRAGESQGFRPLCEEESPS